jgi:stress response protein YsnF
VAARQTISIRDADGHRIEVELVERAADGLIVRRPDGEPWAIPTEIIERHDASGVQLAKRFDDVRGAAGGADGERVIPLVEEQAVIETRERPTATVRVRTRAHERDEIVDEEVSRETVEIKRVKVDRFVEQPVPVRTEGGTTIVSLHEEVLAVEKRLVLREEIHLIKHEERDRTHTRVGLRSQRAQVERIEHEGREGNDPDET